LDLAKEEIFGPIAAIYKFKSEEEVIELGVGKAAYLGGNPHSFLLKPIYLQA